MLWGIGALALGAAIFRIPVLVRLRVIPGELLTQLRLRRQARDYGLSLTMDQVAYLREVPRWLHLADERGRAQTVLLRLDNGCNLAYSRVSGKLTLLRTLTSISHAGGGTMRGNHV